MIFSYYEVGVAHADLLYSYTSRRKHLRGINFFLVKPCPARLSGWRGAVNVTVFGSHE
jgi:hypothetical protein